MYADHSFLICRVQWLSQFFCSLFFAYERLYTFLIPLFPQKSKHPNNPIKVGSLRSNEGTSVCFVTPYYACFLLQWQEGQLTRKALYRLSLFTTYTYIYVRVCKNNTNIYISSTWDYCEMAKQLKAFLCTNNKKILIYILIYHCFVDFKPTFCDYSVLTYVVIFYNNTILI